MKKSIQKCEMNNHLAEQSVVAVLTSRFVSIVSSVAAAAGGPDLEVGRLRLQKNRDYDYLASLDIF